MERTITIHVAKRWDVMRNDRDIHPITGAEEKVPQCVFSSTSPLSAEQLNELSAKYGTELWVEPTGVFH